MSPIEQNELEMVFSREASRMVDAVFPNGMEPNRRAELLAAITSLAINIMDQTKMHIERGNSL